MEASGVRPVASGVLPGMEVSLKRQSPSGPSLEVPVDWSKPMPETARGHEESLKDGADQSGMAEVGMRKDPVVPGAMAGTGARSRPRPHETLVSW